MTKNYVLPEPSYWIYENYQGWDMADKKLYDKTPDKHRQITYTADQMHEAYAQGAASQLSAEPLYTRKETE